MQKFVALLILAFGFALSASAQAPAAPPSIEVVHPWARATLAGVPTGAIYMILVNKGTADDRLIGVSTPVAAHAAVHQDVVANGVMKMRPVAAFDIKAGGEVALAPGKYHVMLTGMKRPLEPGESFPLTLVFAKSGARQVNVAVADATGTGSTGGMQEGH